VDQRSTIERSRSVAAALAERGVGAVELVAVLGSGLGAVADVLEGAQRIPFDGIDGLPASLVPGHAGEFRHGWLGGREVLLQCGRVHLYEGHDARTVALSIRAAAQLGARRLLLTNAAGCLQPAWRPGSWMRITDHVDLQGDSALFVHERGSGSPYGERLGAVVDRFAQERGLDWHRGVYAGLRGPRYETPAEVRALARFGVDAVGMSTVQEAAVAHALGFEVVGLSCLANLAAGLAAGALSHAEVVEVGARAARELADHLPALLGALAAEPDSR
jgi:purine-nucleoside phosphorylase